jgi:anhydro-N-acetylmuramic acid kinase
VEKLLAGGYFSSLPPKSCGREEFGATFVERMLRLCKGTAKEDVVATATALTSASILAAYCRFCWPHLGQRAPLAKCDGGFVAGGGAKNRTLMRMLREGFAELGVRSRRRRVRGLRSKRRRLRRSRCWGG